MNIDRYTKVILTIIAACLSVLTLKEVGFIPVAYAQSIQRVVICDGVEPRCADVRRNGSIDGLVITQ
tara:strand:- start:419 stop:619 length:201 start_codon:yes stop_codon:yes gene_type:complete